MRLGIEVGKETILLFLFEMKDIAFYNLNLEDIDSVFKRF